MMNDKLRAAAAIVLALALFSAIWVLLYRVYSAAVGSQSLTIPVLVAVFATLGLGRLHPRLRLGSGAVVILVCLVAYTFDFPRDASRDVVATEYTTFSIATGRGTSLDDYPEPRAIVGHGGNDAIRAPRKHVWAWRGRLSVTSSRGSRTGLNRHRSPRPTQAFCSSSLAPFVPVVQSTHSR